MLWHGGHSRSASSTRRLSRRHGVRVSRPRRKKKAIQVPGEKRGVAGRPRLPADPREANVDGRGSSRLRGEK